MTTKVENGVIESVHLGKEDHGIFTCYVHISAGCTGGGFGGYALDSYDKKLERRVGTAYGMVEAGERNG